MPNSVESIGENAFKDCNNLKQCVISNNITCISKGIFENCNNLTDITIPNGVDTLKKHWNRGHRLESMYYHLLL